MNKNNIIQIVIAFVVLTLGFWAYAAHGDFITKYSYYYYLTDKMKDFFLMLGLSLFLTGKLKRIGYSVSAFLLVRVAWQIWEIENYESANKPYIIDWILILLIVSILFNVFNFNTKKKQSNG